MNSKPVYLHVGLPKCFSTHLQKNLFSCSEKFDYIGANMNDQNKSNRFIQLVLETEHLHFHPNELLDFFYEVSPVPEKPLIISLEGIITGNPSPSFVSGHEALNRISSVFKNIRVLLIIRNQLDWLFSLYTQLSGGKNKVEPTFEEFISKSLYYPYGSWCSRSLYYQSVKYLYNEFSEKNVYVVPFENLRLNPKSVSQEIFFFLDGLIEIDQIHHIWSFPPQNQRKSWFHFIIKNLRKSRIGSLLLAPFNKLPLRLKRQIKSILSNINLSKKMLITSATKDKIKQYYGSDNKKLAQLLDINLSSLGYSFDT